MQHRRLRSGLAAAVAIAFAIVPVAHATSVTYYINQSNNTSFFPDGHDYAKVTVKDVGNDIEFTVSVMSGQFDPDSDFGIGSFGFNHDGGPALTAANFSGLPSGWSATQNSALGGFGMFGWDLDRGSNNRVNQLDFMITGVNGDTPWDYIGFSKDNADNGNQFFALRIGGFKPPDGKSDNYGWFGGCKPPVVPLPASAWLLLSGVAGLGAMARRRGLAAPA
jgi:hypothetical protein